MQHFQILPLFLPELLTVAFSVSASPKMEEVISAERRMEGEEGEICQLPFAEHGQFCACRLEVSGANGRLLAKCLMGCVRMCMQV